MTKQRKSIAHKSRLIRKGWSSAISRKTHNGNNHVDRAARSKEQPWISLSLSILASASGVDVNSRAWGGWLLRSPDRSRKVASSGKEERRGNDDLESETENAKSDARRPHPGVVYSHTVIRCTLPHVCLSHMCAWWTNLKRRREKNSVASSRCDERGTY